MKYKATIIFILGAALLAQAAPKKALQGISEAELRAHVEFLASPQLAGRDAPGPGSELAQQYLARLFREYGLEEFPEMPGYYQTVPLLVGKTDYERSRMIVQKDGQTNEYLPNQEVFFFPRGGEAADITAPVLLCGYGIRAPEFQYDDFAGADVKGKFLLIFNREPQDTDSTSVFNGTKSTKYANPQVKVRIAKEMGALGLLIIQPPNNHLPPIETTLERYRRSMNDPLIQLAEEKNAFPVFYLKAEVAAALLGKEFDLAAYQKNIDDTFQGDPRSLPDLQVTLSLRFKEVEETQTANVVGYLPGRTDEYVILIAHHDHLGIVNGLAHYGADDNASGVAGLLGVARACMLGGKTPRRGIIFLSTGAEEDGTLGSLYFTRHLPVAADKIVTAINMDEIGRDASSQFKAMQDSSFKPEANMLMVFYSGQTPILKKFAEQENRAIRLQLILEPVLHFSGSSDHIHFADLQIPSIFLFTGFHSDYHSPQDTAEKLNYEKMTRITRLAYGLTWDVAQALQRPTFDVNITKVTGTGRKYGN